MAGQKKILFSKFICLLFSVLFLKMKKRKIYWSRKNKKIICEGRRKGKTIYLFQLPSPETFIKRLSNVNLANPKETKPIVLFTKEKWQEIKQKLNRLDYKESNDNK
ncbi:MAG: hypothetical protein ACFFDN_50830 [Candidatus Hodarchaeota archaeon]